MHTGASMPVLDVHSDTDFTSDLQNCDRMKCCCSESCTLRCAATGWAGKYEASGGASARGIPGGRHTFLACPFPEVGVAAKFYHLISHVECLRKDSVAMGGFVVSTTRPEASSLCQHTSWNTCFIRQPGQTGETGSLT